MEIWLTGLLLLGLGAPAPLTGTSPQPRPPRIFGPAGLTQPADSIRLIHSAMIPVLAPEPSHRLRNALIGGAIGAAAGIVTCTVISNLTKDPGTGFSTCTWKGYLLLGGSGFGLGATIGALIK